MASDSHPLSQSTSSISSSDLRQQHHQQRSSLVPPFRPGAPDGIKLDTKLRQGAGGGGDRYTILAGTDANYRPIPAGGKRRWGGIDVAESEGEVSGSGRGGRLDDVSSSSAVAERQAEEDREFELVSGVMERMRAEEDRLAAERELREREKLRRDMKDLDRRERSGGVEGRRRSLSPPHLSTGADRFGSGGGQRLETERREHELVARERHAREEIRARREQEDLERDRERRSAMAGGGGGGGIGPGTRKDGLESPPKRAWADRRKEKQDEEDRTVVSRQEVRLDSSLLVVFFFVRFWH